MFAWLEVNCEEWTPTNDEFPLVKLTTQNVNRYQNKWSTKIYSVYRRWWLHMTEIGEVIRIFLIEFFFSLLRLNRTSKFCWNKINWLHGSPLDGKFKTKIRCFGIKVSYLSVESTPMAPIAAPTVMSTIPLLSITLLRVISSSSVLWVS